MAQNSDLGPRFGAPTPTPPTVLSGDGTIPSTDKHLPDGVKVYVCASVSICPAILTLLETICWPSALARTTPLTDLQSFLT